MTTADFSSPWWGGIAKKMARNKVLGAFALCLFAFRLKDITPRNGTSLVGMLFTSATIHYLETFSYIILAKSLALRGVKAMAILPGYLYAINLDRLGWWRTRLKWCQVMLLLRISRIPYVVLSDFIDENDVATAKRIWNNKVPPETGDDRVVDSHALALRHTQISSPYYNTKHDPGFKQKFRPVRACAQLMGISARRFLSGSRVDKVLLFNGKSMYTEAFALICQDMGIAVDTWELSLRKGTCIFNHGTLPAAYGPAADLFQRYGLKTLTSTERKRITKFFLDKSKGKAIHTPMSGQSVEFELPFKQQKDTRIILLLSNIPWDTATIGRKGCFASLGDWIAETVRHYADNAGTQIVIKAHPFIEIMNINAQTITDFLVKKLGGIPKNTTVLDKSVSYPNERLFEYADHVVVYNSTSALDYAIHGKKAIVVAETHFAGKGFTLDPPNSQAYFDLLEGRTSPKLSSDEKEMLLRYLNYLFFKVSIKTRLVGEGPLQEIRAPFWLTSVRELLPGEINSIDTICNGLIHDADYVV